jgi:site-specific recombinase XerD
MKAPVSLTPEELLAVLAKAKARRLRDWVILLTLYWHGFRVSEVVRSSTRQLGLFFTREKAEKRCIEARAGAVIEEVERVVKRQRRTCYLVTAAAPVTKPGLTMDALEGQEITVQRLKRSMETVQGLQEHENPLLDEKRAWQEWLAERDLHGKKGGSRMVQNNVLCSIGAGESLFHISRGQVFRLFRQYATEAGLPKRKRHPHCLKHSIGTDLVEAGVPLPKVQVHLGHRSLASTGQYTLPKEDAVSRAVGQAIRGKDAFRQVQQSKLFPPG